MGPAAGIGLIVYFRALNAAYGGTAKLRNDGPDNDPHPADILRGYLAAETVALLLFADSKVWSDLIAKETDKDAGRITVAGEVITSKIARDSARIVADTLVQFKPDALEQHALGQIQNWRDADEQIVKTVREVLRTGTSLPASQPNKIYAAHVVAAAAIESLANGPGIVSVFDHMKTILKTLHDQNPAWGPLFVRHPGNVVRDVYYLKRG
jgi:hypothetical protein